MLGQFSGYLFLCGALLCIAAFLGRSGNVLDGMSGSISLWLPMFLAGCWRLPFWLDVGSHFSDWMWTLSGWVSERRLSTGARFPRFCSGVFCFLCFRGVAQIPPVFIRVGPLGLHLEGLISWALRYLSVSDACPVHCSWLCSTGHCSWDVGTITVFGTLEQSLSQKQQAAANSVH